MKTYWVTDKKGRILYAGKTRALAFHHAIQKLNRILLLKSLTHLEKLIFYIAENDNDRDYQNTSN